MPGNNDFECTNTVTNIGFCSRIRESPNTWKHFGPEQTQVQYSVGRYAWRLSWYYAIYSVGQYTIILSW